MKDLGTTKKILGMQIERDDRRNQLGILQKSYLLKVLDRFAISKAKPMATPTASHFKLTSQLNPSNEEEEFMSKVPYANVVGSVMYSMICTRPDLAFASTLISKFLSNPGNGHWNVVK